MMQRRKRFIKGLSLLVVLIICGLLINNWFFKLNTMRLPELKKQAAQYVVQQYENKKNGLKSDFGSAENIDLETATISGPFLGVSQANQLLLNIDLYWVISSQEKVVGTVEQDLGRYSPADGNFDIEKNDEQVSEIIESHLGEEHLDFMANPERVVDLAK